MRPEHWIYTIRLRLRSLFRRAQADQELDDELRDHLEQDWPGLFQNAGHGIVGRAGLRPAGYAYFL